MDYLIKMAQIKLTVTNKLKRNIEDKAKNIGIKSTQFIMSLIITDLNKDKKENKNV